MRTPLALSLSLYLCLAPLSAAAAPADPPVPKPRPAASSSNETPDAPVPEPKPEQPLAEKEQARDFIGPPAPPANMRATPEPPPIEVEDPAAHAQCLKDLSALGAIFTPLPRIDDKDGCGIDRPIEVSRVLPQVALRPNAVVRCQTALQLARMTRDMLLPTTRLALTDKGPLTEIEHGSGYVCRNRNGAEHGKISEHARGNAIDLVALRFEKGDLPMRIVEAEGSTLEDAFQRSLNAFACLYFATVLSPGSDEAHKDHMHLDVLDRKNGYRYCR